jgi:hypothetical protein
LIPHFTTEALGKIVTHQDHFQSGCDGAFHTNVFHRHLHDRNGYKDAPVGADINVEFSPEDNRYLVVHECSGLDSRASDSQDLQTIRNFISRRTDANCIPPERLHAVW